MLTPTYFEELSKKLLSAFPQHLKTIESDMQQKFRDILQAAFANLDLVTREEFDVQTKVLLRTREKVEALKKQLDNILNNTMPPST